MATTVSSTVSLGRFVWVELMTPDVKAAIDFYTKVVGWSTAPWGDAGAPNPYIMWTAPTGPVGGVMAIGAELKARGVPPHWMSHVSTPDCDALVKKATALGGTVKMPPTDIPEVGRFAVFGDPQGAVLSAFTPNTEMPPHAPQTQEWCWHELATTDAKAAFDFYHTLFGWEKVSAMEMGPGNVYQIFGRGDQSLGGMYNIEPKGSRPAHWMPYVEVADVTRAAGQVRQLGGKVLNEMDVPGGRVAMIIDPQGAAIGLHTAKK
jgi:uncharacterized protein